MSLIVKPNTFSAGAVIIATEHNSNFDTIYNDFNGNITNANLASGAAIADTKLGQITTAQKVSGAALTALASVPSAAGYLPALNVIVNSGNFASTGSGTIMMAKATAMTSNGWAILRFVGGQTAFVPYWVGVSS
jgi:hypothetical protein